MKYLPNTLLSTLALLILCLSLQTAQAQDPVFRVRNVSDVWVPNACETNTSGCSLRGAILAANPVRGSGAIIQFNIPQTEPTCSGGTCTIILNSALPTVVGSGIRILGPGADRLVIAPSASTQAQIFRVENTSGTVSIYGVTLRDGTAQLGGAVAKFGAGTLYLDHILFKNNRAAQGGAIYVGAGTAIVQISTFQENSALITPSTMISNSGGAIYALGDELNIFECTIVSNSSRSGGGISTFAATTLQHSTVARNSATQTSGGGISGSPSVKSSIIAENTAVTTGPDVFGNVISGGFNLIGKADGSTGFNSPTDLKGTIAAPLDPKFDPNGLSLNGGTMPTLAITLQSPGIDRGSNILLDPNISIAIDQRGVFRPRDNPTIPNASGGNGTDIGAYERYVTNVFDFDGDGKTDVAIFRPSVAEWWLYRSSNGSTFAAQFGAPTDKAVPADFTGDGKADIAFWRPSTGEWFIVRSEDGTYFSGPFGANGDIPVPADYDADGKADVAVFRPSTGFWFIKDRFGNTSAQLFGTNGDRPIPSDYDGDGRADVAIYRPSAGEWWLNRSVAGTIAYAFGSSTDKIVPADYTGDGRTDVAFWRPATGEWFVVRSENSTYFSAPFGASTDLPTPGDFDGDGKADVAVFRPSVGTWFINKSTGGTAAQQFGANSDLPIPRAFLP